LLFILPFLLNGCGCRYIRDAQDTVFEQTKLSASLKKYEWFKDAAAALDAKRANLDAYKERMNMLDSTYKGLARSAWARDDREQYNVWSSEFAGLKASYNNLAAEYNAAMSKINYAYANVGETPRGSNPLPREYREYL
jgi:two-component SAPR family response regulator